MYLQNLKKWMKLLLHEVQFTYFKSHINDEKINHNGVITTMKHALYSFIFWYI